VWWRKREERRVETKRRFRILCKEEEEVEGRGLLGESLVAEAQMICRLAVLVMAAACWVSR
jgi:hypothetical protein